ncbi:unnamed protein product [Phytophthora fragariaefolia]|uniref:Unnamed protein product n=1 Tax=Phytophthora fragariaefolia TaxID=1490495 RepID=A0A9W6TW17_9STRA|nr:unnamed protein product [Phytophthora fragariaefolia]
MTNTNRSDSKRATGAYTSLQSTPYSWGFPCATRRALKFSTLPSALYFTTNTQWHGKAFRPGGSGTSHIRAQGFVSTPFYAGLLVPL